MEKFQLPINIEKPKSSVLQRLFLGLKRVVFIEKLMNPIGIAFLLAASLFIALTIKTMGMIGGVLILLILIATPLLYALVAFPKFGLVVLLVAAYLLMWVIKMGINFPLGTLMDGLQALLLLVFLINQKANPNWKIYKNPITYIILVWLGYNILVFFNPVAESRMAWVYTIRTVAIVMLSYFLFMYYIRTKDFIKLIIKLWLALSVFAALYAFKQEHVGFFDFESRILADEKVRSLLFINGAWRKFSIFSDPVAFSYNMVVSSLLCIALITGPISNLKKVILGTMVFLFVMAMLYSGTRGAYVLLPAGLALFSILKYSKKIMMIAAVGAVFMGFLIVIPTSNPTLVRFQSAFKPSDDASFSVRSQNQKMIQPYILTHPIGGGLGATGVWGQRFAPHSFLANFPPDSGYVRVAVELGWIGLLIICTLFFIVLKTGINNYYRIKDPELKSYCLGMVLVIFAFNIGNYPQEAIVQYPSNVYFNLCIALINITFRIDQEKLHGGNS